MSAPKDILRGVRPEAVGAVVFDLGGVFLDGGPRNVAEFGARVGLSMEAWREIALDLFVRGEEWSRVERGEARLDDFAQVLRARLAGHGTQVSLEQARDFMGSPGDRASHPLRPEVVDVCRRLRAVMPTALLTNNIREWREGWRARLPVAELFDLVVDSCEAGVRKPEPAIYRLVEQGLGLPGEALLFVDDLGVNLKAARGLGWQTVKYDSTGAVLAVLEAVLQAGLNAAAPLRPPRGD